MAAAIHLNGVFLEIINWDVRHWHVNAGAVFMKVV